MAVAAVHVALVAPHYHVGSFDDDASYILVAKALLHGAGLTGTVTGGRTVVGYYPPGYSALIAPLVAAFGAPYTAVRVFSAVCAVALLPLTWWWLGRHHVGEWQRTAVLALLALNPVLATFGSMVMAETPFLVVLMAWVWLTDTWAEGDRVLSPAWVGVVTAGAALIWLKQAALGLVVGLCLWLLVCRRWRRLLAVASATVVLLLPVVVARLAVGVPVAGSRYSAELGGYYQGSLLSHLGSVWGHVWELLSSALPLTFLPSGRPPLPTSGPVATALQVWGWSVPVLATVGLILWARRQPWLTLAVVAYFGEVVLYPFINERRVILVLPVVAAWYVAGGGAAVKGVAAAVAWGRPRLGRRLGGARPRPGTGRAWEGAVWVSAGVIVLALVVAPLSWQIRRDYLFAGFQNSSAPLGSRYSELLRRLGPPSTVVETDYLSTTALATGHRTQWSAFQATNNPYTGAPQSCSAPAERAALAADDAGFLLVGRLNKPVALDSPCLYRLALGSPWAVQLLYAARDDATVFELIGPGTAHPALESLVPAARTQFAGGDFTWSWSRPQQVTQVVVGSAYDAGGTAQVTVSELRPGAGWVTVAGAAGAVGRGAVPFLLATSGAGVPVLAVRVTVSGQGPSRLGTVSVIGR
ncbi:MAG TPA: hypothetical protein VKU91_07595 [Acidimicrobiales bacterium]|nr:hypothetical protein [Acidimicrobiales bacterium]